MVAEQAAAAEAALEPVELPSENPRADALLEFLKESDPSWVKQDKSCIMVLHEFTTRKNLQVRSVREWSWWTHTRGGNASCLQTAHMTI